MVFRERIDHCHASTSPCKVRRTTKAADVGEEKKTRVAESPRSACSPSPTKGTPGAHNVHKSHALYRLWVLGLHRAPEFDEDSSCREKEPTTPRMPEKGFLVRSLLSCKNGMTAWKTLHSIVRECAPAKGFIGSVCQVNRSRVTLNLATLPTCRQES